MKLLVYLTIVPFSAFPLPNLLRKLLVSRPKL